MLEEQPAEALDDRAERLSVDDQWIDGAADILNHDVVKNGDMAGPRIDGDVRGLCAIGPGDVAGARAAVGLDRTFALGGEVIQRDRASIGAGHLLVAERYIGGRDAELAAPDP